MQQHEVEVAEARRDRLTSEVGDCLSRTTDGTTFSTDYHPVERHSNLSVVSWACSASLRQRLKSIAEWDP